MNEKNYKGHLAMLAANVIWGLNAPIGKTVLGSGISALSLTIFRMAGAVIAFWIASIFTKREQVKSKDLFLLFFAALFGIVLNQGCFIFGLSVGVYVVTQSKSKAQLDALKVSQKEQEENVSTKKQ